MRRESHAQFYERPVASAGLLTQAIKILDRNDSRERRKVSADKAHDTAQFVAECRERGVTPQVAMNISGTRRSAIGARATCHGATNAYDRGSRARRV